MNSIDICHCEFEQVSEVNWNDLACCGADTNRLALI